MIEFTRDQEGGIFQLSCEVLLEHPRSDVFAFFSDAFQLEQLTPPWLSFRIVTPAPIELRSGCLIDYRIRLHGLPIRWRTEISSWDAPHSFTDRQLRGPYRLWEHLHTFEEVEGGTLASDRVRYCVPGGRLMNWLFVERELRRIFVYRQERMQELFPQRSTTARTHGIAVGDSVNAGVLT